MGGGLGVAGLVCLMRADRLSRLVVMSSFLDESKSCSGVGPGSRLVSDDTNMVCHMLAMGAVRGSWVVEVCVRVFRCSGDSACKYAANSVAMLRVMMGGQSGVPPL